MDAYLVIKLNAYYKATLHRALWKSIDGAVTVYVHADDCEGARNRLSSVLGRLAPDQGSAIELGKVYSYADLLATESSECEDLRIFEVEGTGKAATEWIDRPLFLSSDQTSIAHWAILLMHRVGVAALAI